MDAEAQAQLREAERLIEAGALERAYAIAADVNKRFPNAAEPHFVVALVCLQRNAFPAALRALDRFVALAPASAGVEALRAQAHFHLRQPHEAIAAAERVLAHADVNVLALLAAGGVLLSFGKAERALACFRAASERDAPAARMHLATALHVSGALDEAEAAYRAVLAADRTQALAWFSLTQLRRNALTEAEIVEVKALMARAANAEDALHLAHAVAKTLEDAGEHEAGLALLAAPKRAMRAVRAYDFDASRRVFAEAHATYSADVAAGGDPSEAPIFIVGLPRTGTTLVERILTAHPEVGSAGETDLFGVALRTVANANREAPDMRAVGAEYLRVVSALAPPSPRIIDKLPLNFLSAGLIHRALPNARIIALRRGGADTCAANYAQFFSSDVRYGYTFDLADTARYYVLFDQLMARWRAVLPPSRFTELHYERLIADQEGETRRLLAFCGLDWNESCLTFNEQTSAVLTASTAQVRQPLYASSIGRWKKYGASFEPALAVLREAGIAIDGPA